MHSKQIYEPRETFGILFSLEITLVLTKLFLPYYPLEDPEDTNMPSGDREPRLRAVKHKPRVKRKIYCQDEKKGMRMDKASITFTFNVLHPLSWPH